MSHFLLPQRVPAAPAPPDGRYGEEALWLMLRELERLDIEPSQCKAKIFGGGNMFPDQVRGTGPCIGRKNGEAARALLAAQRIEVVSASLYGSGHRQIVFEVSSGDVWVRQMKLAEAGARDNP